MNRTVRSFRIAAEIERTKWKQFRSYLNKKHRKMFDQMYDYVKLYNTALAPSESKTETTTTETGIIV